jgi:ATP-dependent DNA helicase RecQ
MKTTPSIEENALGLLRVALRNPEARFRDGQWSTIEDLVAHRRKTLLVQRTGWGKSIVYFISARLFRERGLGPTIIISPLLALMRNQIAAAERIGVRALTINSTNQDEWEAVKGEVLADKADVMLISPERLANDEFVQKILLPVGQRVALIVVDEAHCISDWGHDFRPDYRRIVHILRQMPPNIPVLGTTATANTRVVRDIAEQLGDIRIVRGSLMRESLTLQNIRLPDQAARLAWLAEQVPGLPGTGIIYTLTKRDADQVAAWLQRNGILAAPYYSDVKHPDFPDSDAYRRNLEERLLTNDLKALVATTALGMGYDKPDLGFVIHYQAPGSVIAYYQQDGRAGRAVDHAYGILLSGREDGEIHEYFRESAFPPEAHVEEILRTLDESDGLTSDELLREVNLKKAQVEQALKLLTVQSPAPVIKDCSKWHRTAIAYDMDRERIAFLTNQKSSEWEEIQRYIDHKGCLMEFLSEALDDTDPRPCGKCTGCRPDLALPVEPGHAWTTEAIRFLRWGELPLYAKKLVNKGSFPTYGFQGNLEKQGLLSETGRILSRWGDAGWGRLVAENRRKGYFDEVLIDAAASMILERWEPQPAPCWVTCVPSFRQPDLVPDFAKRLALRLAIPFFDAIAKVVHNEPQKAKKNRFHQCRNLDGAFELRGDVPEGAVLLVDDLVDSGWTLTVIGVLLRKAGCGRVYPLALATTTGG